jgi:hypothetical protein
MVVVVGAAPDARADAGIKARLSCRLPDGTVLANGKARRLDKDVTCDIVVIGKDDPVAANRFRFATIGVDRKQARVMSPVRLPRDTTRKTDDPRIVYTTAAAFETERDFKPCEDTVFRAVIGNDKQILWSSQLVVPSACKRPKVTPKLACTRGPIELECSLTLRKPPAGLTLVLHSFLLTGDTVEAAVASETTRASGTVPSLTQTTPCEVHGELYTHEGTYVWGKTVTPTNCR